MAVCSDQTTIFAFASSNGNTRTEYTVPVLNAVDPAACTGLVVISPSEYAVYQSAVQLSTGSFDYVQAAAIFSFFFSFVVCCWLVAKNAGLILEAVRKW